MRNLIWKFAASAVVLLLYVTYAFAQSDRIQPYCGPGDVQFEVLTSKHKVDTGIDPGKAMVYVVQVVRTPWFEPRSPTIRVGLDGNWIGAT